MADHTRTTLTLDEAMEAIRAIVVDKQTTGRHCTVPLEITIDDRGRIKDVWYQPPKMRLCKLFPRDA